MTHLRLKYRRMNDAALPGHSPRCTLVICLCGAIVCAAVLVAVATPTTAAPIEVEAYGGQPFGVGRIVFDQPLPAGGDLADAVGLRAAETPGRVHYPAAGSSTTAQVADSARQILGRAQRPALRIIGQLLPRSTKGELYFLFHGDEPLDLAVSFAPGRRLVVVPQNDSQRHRELLERWWKHYADRPGRLEGWLTGPECPQQVQTYLELMLAQRLNLPLRSDGVSKSFEALFAEELGLALGSEKLLADLFEERFRGAAWWHRPADLQLPEPIPVPELRVPPANDVTVEPIALRVPAECFYVRFGQFTNFLWAQDFLGRFGGDLQNLIVLRGLHYGGARRIEEGLVLRQSVLSRLFGEAVVADVALVGTDLFFHDGGAFGLLFQAQNSLVLAADLKQQRADRLARDPSVTEKRLRIAGHEVSLLTSSDGRVCSYYAADGDFHFVARSRYLVERFLQTADGTGSLGATNEFRYARSVFPAARNDAVFVYLSDPFWRNFTGPQYRIETMRRLQAAADVKLVELARLAARAEGLPAESIEQLAAGGFLPPGFGPRPDGSQTLLEAGRVFDSQRGSPGSFLPVPDVPVAAATRHEVDKYAAFTRHYTSHWERLDPVVIAVGRQPVDVRTERITIDLRISPLAKGNYRHLFQWLGPADTQEMASIAGNAVAGEVVLRSGRIFGGLQALRLPNPSTSDVLGDTAASIGDAPWADLAATALAAISRQVRLRDLVVGYVGSIGDLGPLRLLDVGGPKQSDPAGLARSPTGMWRLRSGPFTVFSFQPDVLAQVAPRLQLAEAAHPAHLRLWIDDISKAPAAATLNRWACDRARRTTAGNAKLLRQLEQQLHVPAAQCRDVAEQLLGARLRCPLGGDYVLRQRADGTQYWTSTALDEPGVSFRSEPGTQPPAGFVAPPFDWFRGLKARAHAGADALDAHVELLVEMPEAKDNSGKRPEVLGHSQKNAPGSFLRLPLPGLPALRPPEKQP